MSANRFASKSTYRNGEISDGVASLTNGKSAMAYALNGLANNNGNGDEWTPDTSARASDDEDYDTLQIESDTLVAGSEGGGIEKGITHSKPIQSRAPKPLSSHTGSSHGENHGRRKSIQVILEKTDKKGRYTLTADDPEIREILRHSIERESSKVKGKKSRTQFRDLVFTRQFTTFDRQNPLSSQSPFHGFFTLFWLAIALLLLRLAAQNWKLQGSVFGEAQILHMMVDRDLLVMGLTDGVMTLATAFGFILQKLIAKGYLSWNRSGWIIQSLWESIFICAAIGWTFYREWPWTHTVFIVLHACVFWMKQHSYSFYNGYRMFL